MEWLRHLPIAHRGLIGPDHGRVENTLAAIEAAAEAGYAAEIDIQVSADGEAIVFHDRTLDRLTAAHGPVADYTAKVLARTHVTGASGCIPTLGTVLDMVAGRVPLLIELKTFGETPRPLVHRLADLVERYQGEVAVTSFWWAALAACVERMPGVPRGIAGARHMRGPGFETLDARLRSRFLLSVHDAKPDFVVYGSRGLPGFGPTQLRRAGKPLLTFVVRTEPELTRAKSLADNVIFETVRPPLPLPGFVATRAISS